MKRQAVVATLWRARAQLWTVFPFVPVACVPAFILRRFGVREVGNRIVIWTAERRRHVLERHPEVVAWEENFPAVISTPDQVFRNVRDAAIANFYKAIGDGRYLRLTIVLQSRAGRYKHSLITARIAREREILKVRARGLQIWP